MVEPTIHRVQSALDGAKTVSMDVLVGLDPPENLVDPGHVILESAHTAFDGLGGHGDERTSLFSDPRGPSEICGWRRVRLRKMYDAAIAWAQSHLDQTVTDVVPLEGGMTSAMLALTGPSGAAAVLRLMTEEPWRTHGRELVERESVTQCMLATTGVPSPRSIAIDADGEATGHPAHLMTLLPGSLDQSRTDDASLAAIAGLLASIHRVVGAPPPRDYQSWAWPTKWVVPVWAARPDLWRAAFDLLASEPPPFEPTFLHRDFGVHNLLWTDGAITGVVDWVETSTGPAWLDVAHCSSNLALRHGSPAGQRFAAAYTQVTGVSREPYWEVMDIVGFLPPPGRRPMFDDPAQLARLDEHLAWAMR